MTLGWTSSQRLADRLHEALHQQPIGAWSGTDYATTTDVIVSALVLALQSVNAQASMVKVRVEHHHPALPPDRFTHAYLKVDGGLFSVSHRQETSTEWDHGSIEPIGMAHAVERTTAWAHRYFLGIGEEPQKRVGGVQVIERLTPYLEPSAWARMLEATRPALSAFLLDQNTSRSAPASSAPRL